MYLPLETPATLATESQGSDDLSTFGVLKKGIAEGVGMGFTGASVRALQERASREPGRTTARIPTDSLMYVPPDPKLAPLSEKDWQDGGYSRPGLQYEPGMTIRRAELLASTVDKKDQDAYVDAHWHGAFAGTVKTLGNVAGSAMDPTMYLGVVPKAATAFVAKGLGPVLAEGLTQAVTNGVLVGASSAQDQETQADLQQTPDWGMVAHSTAIAAAFGFGLGTLAKYFDRASTEARTTATAKALDDISQGRPVDVAPVLERTTTQEAALKTLSDPTVPIELQQKAARELGIDPSLPPEQIAARIAELPKEGKPDFSVAVPKEEVLRVPEATGEEGIGIAPEIEQHINNRFKDLEANEGTRRFAKEAMDSIKEPEGVIDRGKALIDAAKCMALELF